MKSLELKSIGTVRGGGDSPATIELSAEYHSALVGLQGFGHLQVLWWCSKLDNPEARSVTQIPKPYRAGPELLGIFATRCPARPNPIAVTVVQPLGIDLEKGTICLPYIDAFDGTPVLDIKPYTPSSDRVESPQVPAWCAHWPKNLEDGAAFDWAAELKFPD